jgi:hypothetical protein
MTMSDWRSILFARGTTIEPAIFERRAVVSALTVAAPGNRLVLSCPRSRRQPLVLAYMIIAKVRDDLNDSGRPVRQHLVLRQKKAVLRDRAPVPINVRRKKLIIPDGGKPVEPWGHHAGSWL